MLCRMSRWTAAVTTGRAPMGTSFFARLEPTCNPRWNSRSRLGRLPGSCPNPLPTPFCSPSLSLPPITIPRWLLTSDHARSPRLFHSPEEDMFSLLGIPRSFHRVRRGPVPLRHSAGLSFTEVSPLFLGHQTSDWTFSPPTCLVRFLAFPPPFSGFPSEPWNGVRGL